MLTSKYALALINAKTASTYEAGLAIRVAAFLLLNNHSPVNQIQLALDWANHAELLTQELLSAYAERESFQPSFQ